MKICPKCAAENADTAKFCNECGTALEIKKTETQETVNDPEPVSETSKENISTVENVESTPVAIAETVRDGLESTTEQIEKKEEPSPKKKNHLIIGIVAVALVCIIGFIATRPRLKSLEVAYDGNAEDGVVLDSDNPAFTVTAVYTNGKKEIVPAGEWQITEPQTLVADESTEVEISYKSKKVSITIPCTSSRADHIEARYLGATEDGTTVSRQSNIEVILAYKNGQTRKLNSNNWAVSPEITILHNGVTANIKVYCFDESGKEYSSQLSIVGTEKPFECITEKYYKTASSLTVSDLLKTRKPFGNGYDYCYNNDENMLLVPKDVEWIENPLNKDGTVEDGAVYRKIAYVLTGIDAGFANYKNFAKYMLGYTPDTKEDFLKHIDDLKSYIVAANSLEPVMKRFESLKSVSGDFNYQYKDSGDFDALNSSFDFTISDVTECAEELDISEEMLGYILSMLNEYGTETTFNKNSCTCILKSY